MFVSNDKNQCKFTEITVDLSGFSNLQQPLTQKTFRYNNKL